MLSETSLIRFSRFCSKIIETLQNSRAHEMVIRKRVLSKIWFVMGFYRNWSLVTETQAQGISIILT